MSTEEMGRDQAAELEQAITQRIVRRTGGLIRRLEVKAVGDYIFLRGRTPSLHLTQLALHGLLEAIGTRGSIRIEHDIQVQGNLPETYPDGVEN
jgi:hypothetical protein